MKPLVRTLALLTLVVASCWAQETYERSNITYPAYGTRFNSKDTVYVSYTTNYTTDLASFEVWTDTGSNQFVQIYAANLTGSALPNGRFPVQLNTLNYDSSAGGSQWKNFFAIQQNATAEADHNAGGLPLNRVDFVLYQDSNAPAQTWSANPPVSTMTTIVTAAHTTTSPSSSPTSTPDNGGLSSGAKAGIGVGVALGVLAFAAIVGLIIFRKRKNKKSGPSVTDQSPSSQAAWPTYQGSDKPFPSSQTSPYYNTASPYSQTQSPPQQYVYEMLGSQNQHEMEGHTPNVVHEMGEYRR